MPYERNMSEMRNRKPICYKQPVRYIELITARCPVTGRNQEGAISAGDFFLVRNCLEVSDILNAKRSQIPVLS